MILRNLKDTLKMNFVSVMVLIIEAYDQKRTIG